MRSWSHRFEEAGTGLVAEVAGDWYIDCCVINAYFWTGTPGEAVEAIVAGD